MARFYAQGAPSWWPYQLVSLGNRRLPARRYFYYSILVDNGMFRYYKSSATPPDLDKWYADLRRFIHDIERLRKPREIAVILPDWLNNPSFTLRAASHPAARSLCRDYDCYIVVHSAPTLVQWIPGHGEYYGGYARSAMEAVSAAEAVGLAAPLKLNCSKQTNGRRVIRLYCQRAIAEQVCMVAKRQGLHCHGLGVALKPEHVKRLVELGLTSFDSTSWTRPNASIAERWSAKTKTEKERFFKLVLQRLAEAGVRLEGIELEVAGND